MLTESGARERIAREAQWEQEATAALLATAQAYVHAGGRLSERLMAELRLAAEAAEETAAAAR